MPEQMEVEIAFRDSISAGLRQVAREVENITKQMKEAQAAGDSAFNKINKGGEDAKKASDKAKESVGGLSGLLINMSRTLMGATGVASGFIAVSNALEGVAQKRVHVQMLAIDLGTTHEQMSIMQRTMARMGMEAGASEEIISHLGHSFKDIFVHREFSPLISKLLEMREGKFAQELVQIAETGTFKQFTDAIRRRHQEIGQSSERAATYFAREVIGIPESVFKMWEQAQKGVKAGHEGSYADSEEYLARSREFADKFEDISKRMQGGLINLFLTVDRLLRQYDWSFTGPFGTVPIPSSPLYGGGGPGDQGPPSEFTKRPSIGDRLPGLKGLKEPKRAGSLGLYESGDVASGRTLSIEDYVKRGMLDEDKKANRTLSDISDTLTVFERTSKGGGGFGGEVGGGGGRVVSLGPSGGGTSVSRSVPSVQSSMRQIGRTSERVAQAKSQHAPIQTEQSLPGSGGSSGVMDRSRLVAEMQANPEMARRLQTIVQGEVGHGASDQRKKIQLETIFNRAIARDQTLAEVTQEYAGPGSKGYYPRSTFTGGRIRNEEEFRKFQENIMGPVAGGSDLSTDVLGFPATGNASGGVASRGIASGRYQRHGTLGGETYVWQENLKQQQRLLASRSGGGGGAGGNIDVSDAKAFMRLRGGHDATLGKETAPDINPELASRLAAAGQAYELETGKKANFGEMGRSKELQSVYYNKYLRGGSIAARPGFSRHQRGEATDIPRGDFLTWLHQGGGKKHGVNFPVRGDPVHAQMDPDFRGTINRSLQRPSSKGNVKAEVDFGNMANASKKSGDELGKFKLLKINSTPQAAKDHEGLMTPGDLAHTPYVP